MRRYITAGTQNHLASIIILYCSIGTTHNVQIQGFVQAVQAGKGIANTNDKINNSTQSCSPAKCPLLPQILTKHY